MLTPLIIRLVTWSVRRPIWVVALSLVLAVASGVYVVGHFSINTDISKLVENEPQWLALGDAMDRAFPQRDQTILAVVEAPAPELADAAADALVAGLKTPAYEHEIGDVSQPGGGPLFERDGLLFLDERARGHNFSACERTAAHQHACA